MERSREDECRYCEQDRHGGWIYCRSCGRLLSRTEVIRVKAGTVRAGASSSASDAER